MKTLWDLEKIMLNGTNKSNNDLTEYIREVTKTVFEIESESPVEKAISAYLGAMRSSDLPAEKFIVPGHAVLFLLMAASYENNSISLMDYTDCALFYKVYSVLNREEIKNLPAKMIYSKRAKISEDEAIQPYFDSLQNLINKLLKDNAEKIAKNQLENNPAYG